MRINKHYKGWTGSVPPPSDEVRGSWAGKKGAEGREWIRFGVIVHRAFGPCPSSPFSHLNASLSVTVATKARRDASSGDAARPGTRRVQCLIQVPHPRENERARAGLGRPLAQGHGFHMSSPSNFSGTPAVPTPPGRGIVSFVRFGSTPTAPVYAEGFMGNVTHRTPRPCG